MLAPWCSNALYLSGLSPLGGLDLTPLAFSVSGALLAWSVFSQHFFDIVPVALNAVFARLSDPVIVLDASMRVVDVNPAGKLLIGEPDAAIIGRQAAEVFAAHADAVGHLAGVMAADTEVVLRTAAGERVFDLRISPLLDGRGQPGGRLIALRDITERHRVEEEMRAALAHERELSDLKSRFISMASHEFRTPLAAILSSAELLEHYGDRWSEDKKLRYLHQIQVATQHMTQLLEDVLVIGKAEAGKIEFGLLCWM